MIRQINEQMNESADRREVIIDMEPLMMAQKKNAKNELAETQSIGRIIWIVAIITLAVTVLFIGCNNYYNQSNAMQRTLQMMELIQSRLREMKYTLGEQIGKGKNGVVIEVLDKKGKEKAVKVTKHGYHVSYQHQMERLQQMDYQRQHEANGENYGERIVPKVYKLDKKGFEIEGTWYSLIEMDLVIGESFLELSQKKKLKEKDIINLISNGVRFFDGYNEDGKIHFDVHSGNLMLTTVGDEIKLVDFGLADKLADFNANPCSKTIPYCRSGITQYMTMGERRVKEAIQKGEYPGATHDFIALLNTILEIVNYQYGLGYLRCNWLYTFQRGKGTVFPIHAKEFQVKQSITCTKEEYWRKMDDKVPKRIIDRLNILMAPLGGVYWCGQDGKFDCYKNINWKETISKLKTLEQREGRTEQEDDLVMIERLAEQSLRKEKWFEIIEHLEYANRSKLQIKMMAEQEQLRTEQLQTELEETRKKRQVHMLILYAVFTTAAFVAAKLI